jgi:hypothetical protein
MKRIRTFTIITALVLCVAACTNNNQNTGGIDSASVSTNPAMGGSTDSGMTSSDSTDIRMPMADSSKAAAASDSSMRK